MFEGFVNPALAAGALLAAVPLVIHLLNRRRHQPLQWAAMRFVLAAYRKTRRRSRLENLLLLLLRMAAVALLALALSRPFLQPNSLLAPLTESRRQVVLLIDGSASTGYRENVETVFERQLVRAREILDDLDGARGDRARLILAAGTPRLLSARAPEDALAVLGTVTSPTDEVLDLGAALAEVATWAEEEAEGGGIEGLEVRLLTDMQRTSFVPATAGVAEDGEGPAAPADSLFATLDKLHGLGIRVLVEDLGPAQVLDAPNLAVESVETFGPILGPGGTVEVGVRIASFGAGGPAIARVVLLVDGERQPSRSVDLTAGGRTEVVFPVVFSAAGHHTVTAQLEGDALAVDDERNQVLAVPPPLRVLLVDGAPAETIDRDEVGLLRAVLEPPAEAAVAGSLAAGGRSPFEPVVVTDLGLAAGEVDVAAFDVIVLANTTTPTARTTAELEAHVAAGAALIVTSGDNVDATRGDWNARFVKPDGTGLLPAVLGPRIAVPDRRADYFRATAFDAEHPALAFFADERWRPFLTEVPIWELTAAEPLDDASVLASIDDADGHPLLLERAYDRGRTFLWTTTIDNAWTKLPESPRTLVPLVHELLRYAGRGREAARNVPVGGALVAEVDSFPRDLVVVRPDGARRPLDGSPTELAEGLWRLPAVTDTDRAGAWRIERADAPPIPFSVQLDPAESDLARLAADEVDGLHPALVAASSQPGDADSDAGDGRAGRGEIWRWLALACLAALIAESLWAAFLGRKRRLA
jgi:uncharacterized membrane protein